MIKLQMGIKVNFTIPGYFLLICVMIVCESVFVEEPKLLQLYKYSWIQRYKRQSECGALEFKCKSGQCVDIDAECDGLIDCGDESDESDCSSIQCPNNVFRCTYGACINNALMCNGKPDCKDNSDEELSICEARATPKPPKSIGIEQFKCSSGEYINAGLVCNGKKDCVDASDEAVKECEDLPCAPKLFFRCDYGACLDKSLQCNGVDDCLDGSDETNCPNIQLSLILKSVCLIPGNPSNGEYQLDAADHLKPGDYAQKYSVIKTICDSGYKPNHVVKQLKYSVCVNGQWLPELPPCEITCPPISSSTSITAVCKRKGVLLEDCTAPLDGTTATLKCQQFYESSEISDNPTRVCRNGKWDYPIPKCVPSTDCGRRREFEGADKLETVVKEGVYPWHAGIYLNDSDAYVCGGSIISPTIVVSVAHCFTEFDGSLRSHEHYKVAAGKYYHIYNDLRDRHAQYSLIKEINIPRNFKGGVRNYEADIAVLVLKTPLHMSVSVQPVCVDWKNEFENSQLTQNNVGLALGWGFTETDENLSDKLKEMHVTFKPFQECYANSPPEFRTFLTSDKICGEGIGNKFICKGDSGSALTFQWKQDRYYIRGIASVTPNIRETGLPTCGPKQATFFTLLSKYIEFIAEINSLHKP